MDVDDEQPAAASQMNAQDTQESTQGATQPVVRDFITDIFGADSDDEDAAAGPSSSLSISNRAGAAPASKPSGAVKDDDDGIFADSDDDAAPSAAAKTSRLRKGGISQAKASASSSSSSSNRNKMDDLFGDDDDDDDVGGRVDKSSKKKRREHSRDGPIQQIKKRRVTRGGGGSGGDGDDAGAATDAAGAAADGDEYDSGDDVQHTAEDENFIDDDDDLADIRGEYDAEDQIFDDERPAFQKKPTTSAKRSSESGGTKKGADDPFSLTLEAMKKPKLKEMSDNEKDKVADQLLRRMGEACVRDEACFREGQPAVYKLQLLKTVQSVVTVKALQHTLLERDLLGALRDWIEPKNDAQKTLPSLAIRTAVYDILMKLPCHTDQLKRSDSLKKPIGHVVLALRKHKQETPENKRLLKELMEKWCRPVFRKVRRRAYGWLVVPFSFFASSPTCPPFLACSLRTRATWSATRRQRTSSRTWLPSVSAARRAKPPPPPRPQLPTARRRRTRARLAATWKQCWPARQAAPRTREPAPVRHTPPASSSRSSRRRSRCRRKSPTKRCMDKRARTS